MDIQSGVCEYQGLRPRASSTDNPRADVEDDEGPRLSRSGEKCELRWLEGGRTLCQASTPPKHCAFTDAHGSLDIDTKDLILDERRNDTSAVLSNSMKP
jgi:hypothetical protein